MAVSDFTPLLNNLSQLHSDAITALITSEESTIPCRITYGTTRFTDCENCKYDSIRGRSSNIYEPGGPYPFTDGQICSLCFGQGKVQLDPTTEAIELVVIFEPKDWINVGRVSTADGRIQTISLLSTTMAKLKRASSIVVGTDVESAERYKYERISEPTPCGFGSTSFVSVMWKKIE